MPHESSRKKNKQTELNRPKTNKGPRLTKATANPPPTVPPPDHYQAWRPGGLEGEEKHLEHQRIDLKEYPEDQDQFIPSLDYASDLYRTMSKATLIDQESGEVYQLIENKRGSARETFLLQEPPTSYSHIPEVPVRTLKREACGGWASGLSGRNKEDKSEYCNDLQLLIPEQDSGSTSSVERFIAVPVSPTYLTDHIRNIQASARPSENSDCTSLVSALVHAPCELPPPTSERLSPIGANSRATSKLSLDILDEETKC